MVVVGIQVQVHDDTADRHIPAAEGEITIRIIINSACNTGRIDIRIGAEVPVVTHGGVDTAHGDNGCRIGSFRLCIAVREHGQELWIRNHHGSGGCSGRNGSRPITVAVRGDRDQLPGGVFNQHIHARQVGFAVVLNAVPVRVLVEMAADGPGNGVKEITPRLAAVAQCHADLVVVNAVSGHVRRTYRTGQIRFHHDIIAKGQVAETVIAVACGSRRGDQRLGPDGAIIGCRNTAPGDNIQSAINDLHAVETGEVVGGRNAAVIIDVHAAVDNGESEEGS